MYYVIGGEYTGTDFKIIANNGIEEIYGPFSYRIAEEEWRSRSWRQVDKCYCRYRIVDENDLDQNE